MKQFYFNINFITLKLLPEIFHFIHAFKFKLTTYIPIIFLYLAPSFTVNFPFQSNSGFWKTTRWFEWCPVLVFVHRSTKHLRTRSVSCLKLRSQILFAELLVCTERLARETSFTVGDYGITRDQSTIQPLSVGLEGTLSTLIAFSPKLLVFLLEAQVRTIGTPHWGCGPMQSHSAPANALVSLIIPSNALCLETRNKLLKLFQFF